ncbi:MAG: glutathione peroxidase [Labilithrix sp.]|nr:glutathione peroxidase [Labilithrix sp.]MCW5813656.1 glutathione peroxidase [Labilithrix sp.]
MTTAHDFSAKTITGQDKKLADYKGNVLLVVNVASECGLTPQYTGLEKLQQKYGPKGLKVLGFPANEFGAQEPGTNEQIAQFCKTQYDVSFDMFGKVKVKGEGIDPLFAWLTKETGGDIQWNFGKFLVGKDGAILARFEPKVEPEDPAITSAIEKALG